MILESPLLASAGSKPCLFFKWATLFTFVVAIFLPVAAIAGLRFGLMILIGLGFGATLEGFRFGFAGPWRAMITKRDPAGIWAQLLAIGMVAIFSIPLIENYSSEITGAAAPIGYAMVLGAFVFGAAMQVVLGCGSGTLVNAGSGNIVALIALPFFALGSFLGAYHLFWWTDLGVLPVQKLTGWVGVGITLAMICFVAMALWWKAAPQFRRIPKRLIFAALIVSFLALANLVVAGQPWGVVYGLGL